MSQSVSRSPGRLHAGFCILYALASAASIRAEPVDTLENMQRAVVKVGRELGHSRLSYDSRRLESAAMSIGQRARDCGPPSRELIEEAMAQSYVVEPVHRLMMIRFPADTPQDMLAELPSRLPQMLGARGRSGGSGGRWTHYGIGMPVLPDSHDRCGVIVVLESFIRISYVPRQLAVGASASFSATLQPSFRKPRALLSPPAGGGDVTPLPIVADPDNRNSYNVRYTCPAPGRFLLEILAEDDAGPTVLAKFPCYCGVKPPALHEVAQAAVVAVPPTAHSLVAAEQQTLQLINAERARAGRAPLILDEQLSAVARAHSEDMHRNQYVAHISPQTGSPGDRVKRAGIAIARLTENLVKAPDARSGHRELMESPGHRASILDAAVQRIGIGAALTTSPAGEPWLLITELFASLPEKSSN